MADAPTPEQTEAWTAEAERLRAAVAQLSSGVRRVKFTTAGGSGREVEYDGSSLPLLRRMLDEVEAKLAAKTAPRTAFVVFQRWR